MARFSDKVVLITGALGGIGAATVQWIAKGGARLALTDINRTAADVPADITEGAAETAFWPADLSLQAEVDALFASVMAHYGLSLIHI